MIDTVVITIFALAITLLATPLVIKVARSFNLVDDPQKRPHPAHVQKRVIPRAGGLAIYIGILTTALFFLPWDKPLIGILFGITILLIMGLVDDKLKHFNPYWRLLLLFGAASVTVASGIGIPFITNPLFGLINLPLLPQVPILSLNQLVLSFDFLGPRQIFLLADILALIWIVTLTQIVNWSKGVDGQMPGITLVAAVVLGILSLKFYLLGDLSQLDNAKLAFTVAGVSLGFLFFNWYPAKILPGFSGSTILAFLLAVLSILSTTKVATALLVLAIPTVDFAYTFLRRILNGRSPVWPDRGHLHHRLLDLGWSHQKISLFYILGSALLGAIGLFATTGSKIVVVLIVAAIFVGVIVWLNFFGDYSKRSARGNG